jgi:hypothetical protein
MPKVRNLASRRPGGSRASTGRTERPVTFRLDESRLRLITGLALVDETTIAEQIRLACESYIAARLADPRLNQKAEAAIARFRQEITPLLEGAPATDAPPGGSDASAAKPARDTRSEKSVTLRMANSTVTYFTSLALLDDNTLADQLRASVDAYVQQRREDPELEAQIRQARADRDGLLATLLASA